MLDTAIWTTIGDFRRLSREGTERQVIDVPGHIWPSLWNNSRKAILLYGHVPVGVNVLLLRSEERNRPEWETKIIRVSHLCISDLTDRDARLLTYSGPQPVVDLVFDCAKRGVSRYDRATLVEFR